MNQNERNEMLEEYGRGYDLLMAALAEIPREAWEFKPAPEEWSIHELLVHMADSEIMGVIRLYKLIAEPGSTLMTYDSDIWARGLNYQNQDAEDALQMFKLTRQRTYHLLKSLPNETFMHSAIHPDNVHPEYGEGYTLDKWLKIYVFHVPEHAEQLKKAYQAWKSQKRKSGKG